jgi:histidinol-phosphatase (PHP family)
MQEEKLPLYLDEINSLRAHARGISIYKGLEVDYVPGVISPRDFAALLDYTIGSVHFVDDYQGKRWEIDNTLEVFKAGLEQIFHNDIRAAVTRYFSLTREMITKAPPHIVGHLDKIKMHNMAHPFFEESEPWYKQEVEQTLKAIKYANLIIEVNTRGLYKKKSATTYPSPWILERIHDAHIPVTLNSDAHDPEDLIKEFEQTAAQLKDIGFRQLSVLRNGIWKQTPFTEYGLQP